MTRLPLRRVGADEPRRRHRHRRDRPSAEGETVLPPSSHSGVVGIALQYLGVAVRLGGASPSGFDCSGPRHVRVRADRASRCRIRRTRCGITASPVPEDQLQPGDIVFFNGLGHVGIYIGNGDYIEAPHTGAVVQSEPRPRLGGRLVLRRPAHPLDRLSGRKLTRMRRKPSLRSRLLLLMRTTWNGSISFGLVNIPVGLAPATAASARQSDVAVPAAPPRVPDADQAEALVPGARRRGRRPTRSSRGWEIAKGQFVADRGRGARGARAARHLARDRDHAASSRPARSTRSTSTAPTTSCRRRTEAQRRPYALLLEAMREAGVAGARLVRPRRQGEALPDPAEGRRARARDALCAPRTSRAQEEIDEAVAATEVKKPRSSRSPSRSSPASRAPSTRPRSRASTARRCASCSRRSSRAASCRSRAQPADGGAR